MTSTWENGVARRGEVASPDVVTCQEKNVGLHPADKLLGCRRIRVCGDTEDPAYMDNWSVAGEDEQQR